MKNVILYYIALHYVTLFILHYITLFYIIVFFSQAENLRMKFEAQLQRSPKDSVNAGGRKDHAKSFPLNDIMDSEFLNFLSENFEEVFPCPL